MLLKFGLVAYGHLDRLMPLKFVECPINHVKVGVQLKSSRLYTCIFDYMVGITFKLTNIYRVAQHSKQLSPRQNLLFNSYKVLPPLWVKVIQSFAHLRVNSSRSDYTTSFYSSYTNASFPNLD